MLKTVAVLGMVFAASVALAQDPAAGEETPVADPASEKAKAETTAAADAKEDKEFKPPPGFLTKKRGKLVMYCMKDRTTGTRFVTEKCYDEDQMRQYLLALEIQKRDIDRIRSTCATASTCSHQ